MMIKMLKEYEALCDTMSEEKKVLTEKNQFLYIYTKAYTFLKQGHVIYFKNDYYGSKFLSWDSDQVELVRQGCEQIIEGKGLTAENPFTGLGVFGFGNLFYMLHFENVGRKTFRLKENGKITFLDRIDFRHVINENIVQYYNLVKH